MFQKTDHYKPENKKKKRAKFILCQTSSRLLLISHYIGVSGMHWLAVCKGHVQGAESHGQTQNVVCCEQVSLQPDREDWTQERELHVT